MKKVGIIMLINEEMELLLKKKGIAVSALDIVEKLADKDDRRIYDGANGLYYVHGAVGRTTIWMAYTEENGERVLKDAYSHRMGIRDEFTGKSIKYNEEPLPEDVPRCVCCNRELQDEKLYLHYMCYPFVITLPRCPQCGQAFLTPEIMKKKVAPVERNLEDK